MICAQDIMSENVVVIRDDMLVRQAAHLMLRDRVSGFPVVDTKDQLVGIVTITDLFQVIREAGFGHQDFEFNHEIDHFKDLTVADIMSPHPVGIKGETPMIEVVRLVIDKNIHVFPVLDNNKIVGIVSRHDILNAIFSFE